MSSVTTVRFSDKCIELFNCSQKLNSKPGSKAFEKAIASSQNKVLEVISFLEKNRFWDRHEWVSNGLNEFQLKLKYLKGCVALNGDQQKVRKYVHEIIKIPKKALRDYRACMINGMDQEIDKKYFDLVHQEKFKEAANFREDQRLSIRNTLNKENVLDRATRECKIKTVLYLLDQDADPNFPNTPLFIAAEHFAQAFLLEKKHGRYAVIVPSSKDYESIFKLLIDVGKTNPWTEPDFKFGDRWITWLETNNFEQLEIIVTLFNKHTGKSILHDWTGPHRGDTLLDTVCGNKSTSAMAYLISKGVWVSKYACEWAPPEFRKQLGQIHAEQGRRVYQALEKEEGLKRGGPDVLKLISSFVQ